MSRTITVNPLSQTSISNAVKELKAYKKMLQEFPEKFTTALVEEFKKILSTEAPNGATDLVVDTYVTVEGNVARGVVVFDGKVQFIEFGTGVVGLRNHGGINQEWLDKLNGYSPDYNKGVKIVHVVEGEDNDKDFWVFQKNGQYYTTHGQPANPFIYRSVNELLEKRAEIARAVLGGTYG